MKRLAVLVSVVALLAVTGLLALAVPAGAEVHVNARAARQMAHDYLAWEKREGYTSSYRISHCYGRLTKKRTAWLPTWGVKAYCRVYQDWANPHLGEGADIFHVSVERVGHGARRRCRLWGTTYLTAEWSDPDGRHYSTPEHYIYRPCSYGVRSAQVRRSGPGDAH